MSNKIAEEIILEYMKNYNITVIGMYSTTLLNLANIENIKLINIVNFSNVEIINIKVNLKKPTEGIEYILHNLGIRSLYV